VCNSREEGGRRCPRSHGVPADRQRARRAALRIFASSSAIDVVLLLPPASYAGAEAKRSAEASATMSVVGLAVALSDPSEAVRNAALARASTVKDLDRRGAAEVAAAAVAARRFDLAKAVADLISGRPIQVLDQHQRGLVMLAVDPSTTITRLQAAARHRSANAIVRAALAAHPAATEQMRASEVPHLPTAVCAEWASRSTSGAVLEAIAKRAADLAVMVAANPAAGRTLLAVLARHRDPAVSGSALDSLRRIAQGR